MSFKHILFYIMTYYVMFTNKLFQDFNVRKPIVFLLYTVTRLR